MKFRENRPFVRFADTVTYSIIRTPSYTYDARILYVLEGEVDFSLGELPPKHLSSGAVVYFPCGTLYAFHPVSSFVGVAIDFDLDETYKSETAIFPPITPSQFCKERCQKNEEFDDAQILNSPFIVEGEFALREDFIEIASEFQRGQLFYRERCSSLLFSVLCKIVRRGGVSEKREETFQRIIGFIQNHAPNEVTNQNIAHSLGYDACYLNRVMLAFTGLSLHQYVIKYRIDKAIALLLSTDMRVEEVALQTGFYSTAHFSNQCLKQTGHRPSFYKNKTEEYKKCLE